ncbi:MAG: hypothetical protein ABIO51_07595, partial [Solirubrobacteraceae bacterium]
VLAVLYLVLDPPSADLAAQTYRVGLFEREGPIIWDNYWYGGHHLPGYSVLFPPLAAALGLQLIAALSLIGGTAAFAALTRRLDAPAGSAVWLAFSFAAMLVSGRLAFALGVAFGVAAMLAVTGGRTKTAAALGALTALASPVAALFTALAGVAVSATAWGPAAPGNFRRGSQDPNQGSAGRKSARQDPHAGAATAGLTAAIGAAVVTGLLVLTFPEGGTEPFVASAFWPALTAALIATACTTGAVRTAAALYVLLLTAAFAIGTPLGGNAARLGALVGGPLAVALVRDRRILVLAAIPLAYWSLYPAARDWSQAHGDPARAASYYTPLLAQIDKAGGPPARLEIPFTEGHWEAAHVAEHIPLARGWERQLDRKVNAVFYEGTLSAERYHEWLLENAVRWVALPDAPLDYSAGQEAALIQRGLPYLEEIWRDNHWRLYEVRDASPINATAIEPDSFTTTGGIVKLRWTPYWAVVEGYGCVRRTPRGWTAVEPALNVSEVRVAIRLDPTRALSHGPRCR